MERILASCKNTLRLGILGFIITLTKILQYTLCSEKTPTHVFFYISMKNV